MQLIWYADDSELISEGIGSTTDTFMCGGLLISADQIPILKEKIYAIKRDYADERAPIKWNFKSLRAAYKKHGRMEQYENLLIKSKEWRPRVFEAIADADVKIVIGCVASYIRDRKYIIEKAPELRRMAFSTALTHIGMEIKFSTCRDNHIVLDWPSGDKREPYNTEYAYAYSLGKSGDNKNDYTCGPLSKLGFEDSVKFSTTIHSCMLQLSDLVVGVSQDIVMSALNRDCSSDAHDLFKKILGKFRGSSDCASLMERGFCISKGNKALTDKVRPVLQSFFKQVS